MGAIVDSWFSSADTILLGRNTYQAMQAYWSQVTDPDNLVATQLNGLPKYVASTSLADANWPDTTVLSGNVLEQVADLKAKPGGELQVHGSAGLVGTLHEAGLIDEFRLLVFPVTVGRGKRLFSENAPASSFTLVESRTTSTGAVYSALTPTPFVVGTAHVVDGKEAN
jgi:dihydrofolate reductase